MKIYQVTILVIIAVITWLMIERAQADEFDDFLNNKSINESEMTSVWQSDGSLVNIYGAEDAGMVVKDGEVEYYAIPKNDGSPMFIYDDEMLICTNSGCY